METITVKIETTRQMSELELINELLLKFGPQRVHEVCLRSYLAGARS